MFWNKSSSSVNIMHSSVNMLKIPEFFFNLVKGEFYTL